MQNCDYLYSKKCYVILTHRRFIPECTGNTCISQRDIAIGSVYPCVYREHITATGVTLSTRGLSLCIQGTRITHEQFFNQERFIPVHTGNTYCTNNREQTRAVYPCAYREHPKRLFSLPFQYGLSLCIQGTYQL